MLGALLLLLNRTVSVGSMCLADSPVRTPETALAHYFVLPYKWEIWIPSSYESQHCEVENKLEQLKHLWVATCNSKRNWARQLLPMSYHPAQAKFAEQSTGVAFGPRQL